MASDDDEIARLLREVDAVTGTGAAPSEPVQREQSGKARSGKEVVTTADGAGMGARTKWVGIAAAGSGLVGFVGGTVLAFLPFVDGFSTAIGAAAGAALTAAVGGPPRWLR